MNLEKLKGRFIERFGTTDSHAVIYYSPGRVNLIGDHTDYNGGYVLPCAINHGTYLLARPNRDKKINLASENFDYSTGIKIDNISGKTDEQWTNYPLGVIDQFRKAGHKIPGIDLLFYGNIPHSAGLSSSASIETVTAFALNDITQAGYSNRQLALLAQKAEIEFVGVNCGIMDQFAVALSKKEHALFLDCNTNDYELIALDVKDYRIVVANSNVPRQLSTSKYNERVSECSQALDYLNKARPLKNLSELNFREFISMKHFIPDIIIRKRAMHVLSENQRVLDAVEALKKNNLRLFGKLMNASHNSLRHNYEVSCTELDTLTEISRNIEGVLGSRMTGAGFGGCIFSLVHQDILELYKEKVLDNYYAKTGLQADIYNFETDDGMKKLESFL
jgi:galactokinase